MIRTIIVDDEPPARENLRILLGPEEDIDLVAECGSGEDAVRAIERLDPDLIFLDVQMPGIDGFDVIETVGPSRMPTTVFVTAYDRFALRAFEVRALDYLLKPFDDERFHETLDRARDRMRAREEGDVGRRMLALLAERAGRSDAGGAVATPSSDRGITRLTVRSDDRVVVLHVDEVDRIEAAGDYVRIHAGDRSFLMNETMKTLEGQLDPAQFVRTHRSHIVNVDRIVELRPFFQGQYIVVLETGATVPLARGRRETLETAFGRPL